MANGSIPINIAAPPIATGVASGVSSAFENFNSVVKDLASLKLQEQMRQRELLQQHELSKQQLLFQEQIAQNIRGQQRQELLGRSKIAVEALKGKDTSDPVNVLEAMAKGGFLTGGSFAPLFKTDDASALLEALQIQDVAGRIRERGSRASKRDADKLNQIDDNLRQERKNIASVLKRLNEIGFGATSDEQLSPQEKKEKQNLMDQLAEKQKIVKSIVRQRNQLVPKEDVIPLNAVDQEFEKALQPPEEEESFSLMDLLTRLTGSEATKKAKEAGGKFIDRAKGSLAGFFGVE